MNSPLGEGTANQQPDPEPKLPLGSRDSRLLTFWRYVWVLPATLIGLVAVGLTALSGGYVQIYAGAIEAWGGFAAWVFRRAVRHGCAMTIGHVIIGVDQYSIGRYRPHEHVHIQQYEKWGPLFIPLYLASSLLAWVGGKHIYHDNVFEREAYRRFH